MWRRLSPGKEAVAKTVRDDALTVSLHGHRNVRVVAQYDLGTSIRDCTGAIPLAFQRVQGPLVAPVQIHDNDVGNGSSISHRGCHGTIDSMRGLHFSDACRIDEMIVAEAEHRHSRSVSLDDRGIGRLAADRYATACDSRLAKGFHRFGECLGSKI